MKQSGSITVDFLFAFFLVAGFSLVVITYSATLATVEVVQYMTFAAARNYFAGNISEAAQQKSAQRKFISLANDPIIKPLLNGGWFAVPKDSFIATYDVSQNPALRDYEPNPNINLFQGVVVDFEARILDFQVPFFGGTKKNNPNSKTSGFTTKVTAFLGREPSHFECVDFEKQRFEKILKLTSPSGGAAYKIPGNINTDEKTIVDNGC